MIQGKTGHPEESNTGFLTTSDHDHPRTAPLPVVGNDASAADAEAFTPGDLHDHCLAGFQEAAETALADKSITDEVRAALIEGARTRYGWTVAEVTEWVRRHTA